MFPPPERTLVPVAELVVPINTAWVVDEAGPVGNELPEEPPPM